MQKGTEHDFKGGMRMRLRTLEQAHAELLAADPNSALAKTALRRMVIAGQIPSVRVGAKYLVDIDRLPEYLSQPTADKPKPAGKIRPIDV